MHRTKTLLRTYFYCQRHVVASFSVGRNFAVTLWPYANTRLLFVGIVCIVFVLLLRLWRPSLFIFVFEFLFSFYLLIIYVFVCVFYFRGAAGAVERRSLHLPTRKSQGVLHIAAGGCHCYCCCGYGGGCCAMLCCCCCWWQQ